ncbi:hypothetical protein J1N35_001400 [Gossypium stocksii]|uniref:Uncharacterized protein n=1 Tax=Gossypium stocksii TaxID=47602 RepID=A0A9D4AL20_9ROSI|nr:hypothetical protein J1N35_001400 [Gossypium stocksii]
MVQRRNSLSLFELTSGWHMFAGFAKLIKDLGEEPSQMEWRSMIANRSSHAHRKGGTDGGFTSRFIMVYPNDVLRV